jgi:hypothetical protein
MPVQMIELEEVAMGEVSDDELEDSILSKSGSLSGCTADTTTWCDCTF